MEQWAIALGQLGALTGFYLWSARNTARKLESLMTDVAVIKSQTSTITSDHDKIVEVYSVCDRCNKT